MTLRIFSSFLLLSFSTCLLNRPGHFERPEVQRTITHISLHIQLHRERYSRRSETSARVGSGAAD